MEDFEKLFLLRQDLQETYKFFMESFTSLSEQYRILAKKLLPEVRNDTFDYTNDKYKIILGECEHFHKHKTDSIVIGEIRGTPRILCKECRDSCNEMYISSDKSFAYGHISVKSISDYDYNSPVVELRCADERKIQDYNKNFARCYIENALKKPRLLKKIVSPTFLWVTDLTKQKNTK